MVLQRFVSCLHLLGTSWREAVPLQDRALESTGEPGGTGRQAAASTTTTATKQHSKKQIESDVQSKPKTATSTSRVEENQQHLRQEKHSDMKAGLQGDWVASEGEHKAAPSLGSVPGSTSNPRFCSRTIGMITGWLETQGASIKYQWASVCQWARESCKAKTGNFAYEVCPPLTITSP